MSLSAILAAVSASKAGMALFSAGLGAVSVVSSNIYASANDRVDNRARKRKQNEFDGLLDGAEGQKVGSIKSSVALLSAFDAFVEGVSKKEEKKVRSVSTGLLVLLFFLGMLLWQGKLESEVAKLACEDDCTSQKTMAVIALAFVVAVFLFAPAVLAKTWTFFSGFARKSLDVDIEVWRGDVVEQGIESETEKFMIDHDVKTYNDAKIDVQRRVLATMVGVLESNSMRDELSGKLFVPKPLTAEQNTPAPNSQPQSGDENGRSGQTTNEKQEPEGSEVVSDEFVQRVIEQYDFLRSIEGALPEILKNGFQKKDYAVLNVRDFNYVYRFRFGGQRNLLSVIKNRWRDFRPVERKLRHRLFPWTFEKHVVLWRRRNIHFDARTQAEFISSP